MKKTDKPKNKPAAAPTGKKAKAPRGFAEGKMPLIIGSALIAAFAVMVYVLLLAGYNDYLYKLSELNFFIPGAQYFGDCMRTPGGVVTWLSTLATCTFARPALGASVYALLVLLLTVLTAKAFRMTKTMLAASVLPAGAAVVGLLNLGYAIFSLKSPGYACVPIVGACITAAACWGYRLMPKWYLRAAAMLLWVCLTYRYLGFFALSTAAIAAAGDLGDMLAKRKWLLAVPIVIAIIGIWVVPDVYFTRFANDLHAGRAWLSPLPYFYADEAHLWVPYMIIPLSMGVYALIGCLSQTKVARSVAAMVCAVAIFAAMVVWVVVDRYSDNNFGLTLALDRLLNDDTITPQDKVASMDALWKAMPDEPTRLNIVFSQALLMQAGQAPERIFTLHHGSAMPNWPITRAGRLVYEAGAPAVLYNMGLARYAYRMAMENKVEYGLTAGTLRLLAQTALAAGDSALADKYIATLDKVPFKQAKIAQVKPADGEEENSFVNDNGRLESYMWHLMSVSNPDLERRMVAALMARHIEPFMQMVDTYMLTHKTLPRHFQEGVLAYTLMHNTDDYTRYPISPEVMERYRAFVTLLESSGRMSEEQLFRNVFTQYGDTYWFYIMFYDRLGII